METKEKKLGKELETRVQELMAKEEEIREYRKDIGIIKKSTDKDIPRGAYYFNVWANYVPTSIKNKY